MKNTFPVGIKGGKPTATATTTCVWCNLTAASTLASIRTIYFYFFSLRVFELVGVSECPSFTGHVALHKHTANM